MLYLLVKWIHVLAAIIAIGSNATYAIWLALSSRQPETLAFTLKGIKRIDDSFANPAYVLSLISGALLVWIGEIQLTASWLLTSLVLYAALVLVGLLGYTPALNRQIKTLENYGAQAPEYRSTAARGTTLGIILGVLAVAIVFLMVVKPTLF